MYININMNIKRFFRKELPDVEDIVIVKILTQDQYGYHVTLLEYDSVDGFIPMTQLVKAKYVKKKDMLKLDDIIALTVTYVDEMKNLVELSKKQIKQEEIDLAFKKFKTCSSINRLINECYVMYIDHNKNKTDNHSINYIMENSIWNLYDDTKNTDDESCESIFMNILQNPKLILTEELFDNDFIEKTCQNITNRIITKKFVIETNINLLVLDENGLDKIKEILNVDNFEVPAETKIQTLIISPPLYRIKIESNNKQFAMDLLETIKKSIINKSNRYLTKLKISEPEIISDISFEIKFLVDHDLEKFKLV